MNLLASLLMLTAVAISTPTLVLRSGERISVDEPIRIERSVVLFRSGGSFYSVPSEEVDFEATRAAADAGTVARVATTTKLKATVEDRERLLRDLEQNHTGTPAPREQLTPPEGRRQTSPAGDERQWRAAARQQDEQVRRAKEELELLRQRQAELKGQISGFLSQGYKPEQFSYQTTQLAYVEQAMPRAELEIQRAERERQQFLKDARRQGVMPGWLR